MKTLLTLVLSIIPLLMFSQNTPKLIHLTEKNQPLEKVLKKIEGQANCYISQRQKLIEKVNVNVIYEGHSLDEALSITLKNTELTHSISENFITLKQRKALILQGIILDASDKTPLVGANIFIPAYDAGTSTDHNGQYYLSGRFNPATVISLSYTGYEEQKLSLLELMSQPTILLKNGQDLPAITVFAASNEDINQSTPKVAPQKEHMSIKNMTNPPGFLETEVLQHITTLPGITSNGTTTDLNIRGSAGYQNHITLDQINLYKHSMIYGLFSALPSDLIEEIAVQHTNIPVETGGRISGSINLKTTEQIPEKLTVGAGFSLSDYRVFAKIPLLKEKLGWSVSYRRSFPNALHSPNFKAYKIFFRQMIPLAHSNKSKEIDPESYNATFDELFMKFNLDLSPKDQIALSVINITDNFEYRLNNTDSERWRNFMYRSRQAGFSATWQHRWDKGTTSHLLLTSSLYNIGKYRTILFLPNRSEYDLEESTRYNTTTNRHLARFKFDFTLNDHSSLQLGVESNYFVRDTAANCATCEEMRSIALAHHKGFINENDFSLFNAYSLTKGKVHLVSGLRQTYNFRLHRLFFEPRLSISYSPQKDYSLRFQGGRFHQIEGQPALSQSYLGLINWQVWSNLPPMTATHLSLSASVKKRSWSFFAEAYWKRASNISYRGGGDVAEFHPDTLKNGTPAYYFIKYSGDNINKGFDLEIRKQINNFNLSLNYAFIESSISLDKYYIRKKYRNLFNIRNKVGSPLLHPSKQDLSKEDPKYYRVVKNTVQAFQSPHRFQAILQYQKGGLHLSSRFQVQSERILNRKEENKDPRTFNTVHHLDCSASFQFEFGKIGKARLEAAIINVYNRVLPSGRMIHQDLEDNIHKTLQWNLGRTYNLGISLEL